MDGYTIWLDAMNLRLQAYNTLEPHNDICAGAQEIALAKRASACLLELLNSNGFTIDTFGTDRTLATIRIGGTDVGNILISECLATDGMMGMSSRVDVRAKRHRLAALYILRFYALYGTFHDGDLSLCVAITAHLPSHDNKPMLCQV